MNTPIESLMYSLGQLFLLPVLLTIAALFLYASLALGAFAVQAWQRARGMSGGHELLAWHQRHPHLGLDELELWATQRLERVRIATRIAPMLGLVATMIPMGPALKSLATAQMADVTQALTVAFSAVILALLAAAVTYTIAQVRRRWYASDLLGLERSLSLAAATPMGQPPMSQPHQVEGTHAAGAVHLSTTAIAPGVSA